MAGKKKAPIKKHLLPKAGEGRAEAGVSINPMDLVEIPEEVRPKSAPAPGIPMSEKLFEQLKKKAEGKSKPRPNKSSKT